MAIKRACLACGGLGSIDNLEHGSALPGASRYEAEIARHIEAANRIEERTHMLMPVKDRKLIQSDMWRAAIHLQGAQMLRQLLNQAEALRKQARVAMEEASKSQKLLAALQKRKGKD